MCCCALLLSGCSFGAFTVDTLLSAPKLSQEQQEIHETLIASVGSEISLKYPKSGDNRSAFLIANIDDEPTDEAIVFYEYNNISKENSGIRLCVLDRNDSGKWVCVYEQAGAGTDVDKIIVSQLDRSGRVNIIVGYTTLTMTDKVLEVYAYSGGRLELQAKDTYSVMETIDINNDGFSEIVTVQSGGEGMNATASLLNSRGSEIVKENIISMSSQYQYASAYIKGKVTESNKALFIDSAYGDGNIRTEFIYYRNDALQNPPAQIGERLLSQTVRPDGYYCADVDNDGIIEIPTVTAMTGYEQLPSEEQLYITTWSAYEDFYRFSAKLRGYYSIANGYMYNFDESWLGKVTVKKDSLTGEAVFYLYADSLENSSAELMRIAVCQRNDTDSYRERGYSRITSEGQIDYMVKFSENKRNKMVPSLAQVKSNFYLVG